ncbi:MAG: hypothetical protein AAF557_19440, partial [Pseudomonadota bacterium]
MHSPPDENLPTRDTVRKNLKTARTDLYVYRDSKEKEKWLDLLFQAQDALIDEHIELANGLVQRTQNATDALWKRIERWRKIQINLSILFGIVLAAEVLLVAFFVWPERSNLDLFHVCCAFGLLGATASVALSLGTELQIHKSNRLGLIQTFLRPLIGIANAIAGYLLIETGIINIGTGGTSIIA